jgi:hypothetical protein
VGDGDPIIDTFLARMLDRLDPDAPIGGRSRRSASR